MSMTGAEELDYLKAENAWLKGLLAARAASHPPEWNLSKMEGRIFGRLLAGEATTDQLIEALYWDGDEPETARDSLHIFIYRLRRKIGRHGIAIHGRRGPGPSPYYLDPPGGKIVLREMQKSPHGDLPCSSTRKSRCGSTSPSPS